MPEGWEGISQVERKRISQAEGRWLTKAGVGRAECPEGLGGFHGMRVVWRGWEHRQMWVTECLWDTFRAVDFTPRVKSS